MYASKFMNAINQSINHSINKSSIRSMKHINQADINQIHRTHTATK